MKHLIALTGLLAATLLATEGCKDLGTDPPQPTAGAAITNTLPADSAAVGDTLTINGTNLGFTQGSGSVTVGGRPVTAIFSWSDTQIKVEVPLLAATDSVRVTTGSGSVSNRVRFKAATILFGARILPMFTTYGCTGCHGGQNSLFLDNYANITAGTSNHGPVITAGNGEGSVVVLKLHGTASFGARMPFGSAAIPNADINRISTWIQQGARNN